MKIGILQADSVLPQYQPAHGNYPGMIAGILGDAAGRLGISAEFVTYDVEHDVYPDTLSSCEGYVITGSKRSVYEDEPWIRKLIEFVQALHREKIRLVGICFGHQLVAEALGGKTEGAEAGWGVGIHQWRVLKSPWFMDEPLESFSLIVSHKDQVMKLPEGADLLASSEFCPNSMYTVGDHILTVQGHPEFTREYSRDLMNFRRDMVGEAVYQRGVESLAEPLSSEEVSRWIVKFLSGPPVPSECAAQA